MNIVLAMSVLVAVAITAKVTGASELQLNIEDHFANFSEDHLEHLDHSCKTKKSCKTAGGKCQPKEATCDGDIKRGKKYCKGKGCICCIDNLVDPSAKCGSEERLTKVEETCWDILEPVCAVGTEECEEFKHTCRERICGMLEHKQPAQQSKPKLDDDSCHDLVCDCSWSPGGCKVTKAAPNNCACYCSYKVFWKCVGETVQCKDPDSEFCKNPDTSKESCLQGGGNCDAY